MAVALDGRDQVNRESGEKSACIVMASPIDQWRSARKEKPMFRAGDSRTSGAELVSMVCSLNRRRAVMDAGWLSR
jgi:hypothetical protein